MNPISLDAIEDLALRVRAAHLACEIAALEGEPERPLPPVPSALHLAGAYALARAADPALGVLVAEALVADVLHAPRLAFDVEWTRSPVVLRGEDALPVRGLETALVMEPNAARRAALARAAETLARDKMPAARAVVDALRGTVSRLGLETPALLHGALGLGDAAEVERAYEAVLVATDDVYRELEQWARVRAGLPRIGEIAWEDRLRSLAMMRANELVPAADRAGIASRWLARMGLSDALARVRDQTGTVSLASAGVRAFALRPGERAVLAGAPRPGALGVRDLLAALAEAVALLVPREERAAWRLGVERVHIALAHVLGRRLLCDPLFLVREAAVDRGRREPAALECLYAELFVTRADAALGRFVLDVLSRAADLPARMRDYFSRATGSAPAPAWAAHLAARWPESYPGARAIAALIEPRVSGALREQHDEDWFRNPRAGETLTGFWHAMRASGVVGWAGEGALDAAPLARWVAETLRNARR